MYQPQQDPPSLDGSTTRSQTNPSRETALDIAARSVLEAQSIEGTVAAVVAERALDHHWRGLWQYAVIHVGRDAADEALAMLAQSLEPHAADPGPRRPSVRADLYRRLRVICSAYAAPRPLRAHDPAWWSPASSAYTTRLRVLRRSLSHADAERVELRFARHLSEEEVAYVVGAAVHDVQLSLHRALAVAARVLGSKGSKGRTPASRDQSVGGALHEAFLVDSQRSTASARRRRPALLAAGTLIGQRYEIEALLGAGAFADVYRARDREVTDHVVALKILRTASADEPSVRVAMRELQLIAAVYHPSVVQLKDHGWHQRHLWFVMPLYRGETLATRLQRGPLERTEAREIFEPLAEALATMHRAGVLHQDVKPENVFLANLDPDAAAGGTPARILPVLLDLGVAAKDAELVLAGTPAYFAPEVAARFAGAPDPPPVGPKADVFSLALTLRHALDPTCAADAAASGAVDAFVAWRAEHAPSPPERRDLRDLRPSFERWLHFTPDARPSAEELRRELAVLTRPAERAARRWSLLRWVVPTSVAVLALFGAVVFGLSREAALQRSEAAQARAGAAEARERVASVSADLSQQKARRRELEADISRLTLQYQTSRMTRDQMASRLAQAEGELQLTAERQSAERQRWRQQLDAQREQMRALSTELDTVTGRRDELAAQLDRLARQLEEERDAQRRADAASSQLRRELDEQARVAEQSRAHARELEARISRLGLPETSRAFAGPAGSRITMP